MGPGTNVSAFDVDEAELAGVVSADVSVAVGIVKRYANGSYALRYIGQHARRAQETWSSSKILAGSRAGMRLRALPTQGWQPFCAANSLPAMRIASRGTVAGMSSRACSGCARVRPGGGCGAALTKLKRDGGPAVWARAHLQQGPSPEGLSAVEHGQKAASLADLMTIVTSYDTTSGLTSNGVGAFYQVSTD